MFKFFPSFQVSLRLSLRVFVDYIVTDSSCKAQFRRRASAVPNLIAIRFDCSTAEARL